MLKGKYLCVQCNTKLVFIAIGYYVYEHNNDSEITLFFDLFKLTKLKNERVIKKWAYKDNEKQRQ